MQEAGWYDEAERELINTKTNFPNHKKIVKERLNNLRQVRANLFVEGIQQAATVGQHGIALDQIAIYDKEENDKFVSPRHRLIANDLKADYAKAKAPRRGQTLPPGAATGNEKCCDLDEGVAFIAEELNLDTIGLQKGRLELFLDFAKQYELDLKNKRKPVQSAEQVLALAVTGWLQGNQAAEPDPMMALTLIHARQFVLETMQTESKFKRDSLLNEFKNKNDLRVDVMARLVRMIPPSHAYDLEGVGTKMKLCRSSA